MAYHMSYVNQTLYITKQTDTVWYVNGTDGNDAYDGRTPKSAFATIGAAITAMSNGDTIVVASSTYTEEGLDIDHTGVTVIFEPWVTLDPASGTCLTISGNGCMVQCPEASLRVLPAANETGVLVSGAFCYVHNVRVACGSVADIGFDVTGNGCVLYDCRSSSPLVAAFKVQGDKVKLWECCCGGEEGDSSIGFWVTNSCDKARLKECGSQGNETAGFQFDAGCTNIVANKCESGGGDGHFIDNAERTYLDLEDKDSREEHDHTYPSPDGEGTAGDPVSIASQVNDETGSDDTANYFGDPYVLIPVGGITVDWFYKGVHIYATSVNDEQRFFSYRVLSDFSATRNGGNAWDEGATVLTVQDATEAAQFEVNDLVWISSPNYQPNGEIVKVTDVTGAVITIARQTENSGRTGLHWDHTTNDGGNEIMYLCWRDENKYHSTDFDHSADNARGFISDRWTKPRRMKANDGLVVRMVNGTDNANSQADITVIWSD
jgi:hypothetical protein